MSDTVARSHVDRICQLEERCENLESRLSELAQKISEWQPPLSRHSDARRRFNELVQEWRRTRGHSSKIKDLVANLAYQRIIGMGSVAVPLILEEWERQPGHWSWALSAITGEDPIPPSARGRLDQMAAIWLQWGREKKLI